MCDHSGKEVTNPPWSLLGGKLPWQVANQQVANRPSTTYILADFKVPWIDILKESRYIFCQNKRYYESIARLSITELKINHDLFQRKTSNTNWVVLVQATEYVPPVDVKPSKKLKWWRLKNNVRSWKVFFHTLGPTNNKPNHIDKNTNGTLDLWFWLMPNCLW